MTPDPIFSGKQVLLVEAIDRDDPAAIRAATASGAVLNQPGRQGVTPLHYALVQKKKAAVAELVRLGADPNLRAENGQNAVTLAARLAPQDLDYLRLVLDHGGDPNTREPNDSPILIRLIAESNIEGIRLLASKRADLNITDRTGDPAVLVAGSIEHWEAAYTLLELGADWRKIRGGRTLAYTSTTSSAAPGSAAYPWLKKTIEFLKSKGVAYPPLTPRQILAGQSPEGRN